MAQYTLFSAKPVLLAELLKAHGVVPEMPCAGNHTCGKCKVILHDGAKPPDARELALLRPEEIAAGVRLACFAWVQGHVAVSVYEATGANILAAGGGMILPQQPMMEGEHYGAAIDVGTTTVVCSLFDTQGGEPIDQLCQLNAQRRFGADVISRISYSNRVGHDVLHRALTEQLSDMLQRLCRRNRIALTNVTHAVVTGNTTMLHFAAGLDPAGIGVAPFIPASLFAEYSDAVLPGTMSYLPPCAGGYVGADLLCCILASGAFREDAVSLVVDIGTNGEMAIVDHDRILCCATAAGPAFEGASLSCGMPAAEGAVCSVWLAPDGQLRYRTIADKPPIGICSSGVVEALALLLETGALDDSGRLQAEGALARQISMESGQACFSLAGGAVRITQADVRQIQLAKGAICAGMQTLLSRAGYAGRTVDRLYLCGGFGTYLNLQAAERIAMLPDGYGAIATVLGNGALTGASMLLLRRTAGEELNRIRDCCTYIELSSDPEFMENYIAAMAFSWEDI